MPLTIQNTTVQDAYSEPATFAGYDVFHDGWITVANNPVACQLALGRYGQAGWSDEIYLPPSTVPLRPGQRTPIAGIRFRNFIAGSPAQVFGSLFYPGEAGLGGGTPFDSVVSAGGAVSGTGTGVIAGRVSSAGAILGGSGFTVVRSAVGQYDLTFTTPFNNPPAIVAMLLSVGGGERGFWRVLSATLSTTFARVQHLDAAGVAADASFSFLASEPS